MPIQLSSEFLQYLAGQAATFPTEEGRLPPLTQLSQELGVSVATLREQLEVARAMGLVDVRPRTGIRRLPFSFLPAVRQSLAYAISLNPACFAAFSDLRNHIEAAYWDEAVRRLTPDDHQALSHLVERAWAKLDGTPIQIPHAEHRELHLGIYRRLGNPFVLGLLEAYWEAYEAVGLSVYEDLKYLREVWRYHQKMVSAIVAGEYAAGYQALIEHRELLTKRNL